MKFLVDAQLPRRFAAWLRDAGHDAIHTLDLPLGNRTSDAAIAAISERERRIVVTKDADFVDSHILQHSPERLLFISTGNVTNAALELILRSNLGTIITAFENAEFVELNHSGVVVHD